MLVLRSHIMPLVVASVIGLMPHVGSAEGKQDKQTYTNFWDFLVEAAQENGANKVDQHLVVLLEAMSFINILHDECAFPSIPSNTHGQMLVIPWPTPGNQPFSTNYPFRVRFEITFTNAPIGKQIYALQKPMETGTWSVAKGWLYDTNGIRIGDALLPSQTAQNEANKVAEEQMKNIQKK